MSASAVGKTIFEIKDTEDKTKITTPIISGSGKNVISLGSLDASDSPKISSCGFNAYSITSE